METSFVKNAVIGHKESHNFQDWIIIYEKSHILPSKCTSQCGANNPCSFCGFTKDLKLEHLPEMVFPQNKLRLEHKSGCAIEFNALDALQHVRTTREGSLTIASAEVWRKAREETGLVDKTIGDFDWTFRSSYAGTFMGWPSPEPTTVGIETDRLKQKDKILFYKDLVLFEDELHDNGISMSSVRIRVMDWGYFILLRHFLRVDGVAVSATDTRICHDFSTPYVTVEFSTREGSIPGLGLPLSVLKEPDEVSTILPISSSALKRYNLPV